MKKTIRLTESDLTRIVKRVLSESTVNKTYFRRRGVDIEDLFLKTLYETDVCKYAKMKTLFKHVVDRVILKLYLSNENIKNELVSHENYLEMNIKQFFIDEYLDFLIFYYKSKCGKDIK